MESPEATKGGGTRISLKTTTASLAARVLAAATVACTATFLGFLGRFWWFLDLFAHFRVQYLVGLLGLGILLLWAGRRRTALAVLACAGINLALIVPLYLGRQAPPDDGVPSFRAMLLNVNTQRGDVARVRAVVMDADPDLIVLEEISARWMAGLSWLVESHPNRVTQPREDNFGIGLFSRLPLSDAEVVYIGEAGVPSIVATVDTGRGKVRVVATHPLPPLGREYSRLRNDQLDRVPDLTRSTLPVLLLGDLNVTPWSPHFRSLLARSGLRDSARGFGVQPTWPSGNPLLWIPIDHCLHSPEITVVDRRVGAGVSSDHYPLIVDFAIPTAGQATDGILRCARLRRAWETPWR